MEGVLSTVMSSRSNRDRPPATGPATGPATALATRVADIEQQEQFITELYENGADTLRDAITEEPIEPGMSVYMCCAPQQDLTRRSGIGTGICNKKAPPAGCIISGTTRNATREIADVECPAWIGAGNLAQCCINKNLRAHVASVPSVT